MERYIREVDERVKIDILEPKHKEILDGAEKLVRAICDESESPLKFSYWRGIGSSSASLRVGRPYEVDVLVDTEQSELSRQQVRSQIIQTVCRTVHNNFSHDWRICKIFPHAKGVSVALVFDETVGVLVDIIPVTRLHKPRTKAQISDSWRRLIEKLGIAEEELSAYYLRWSGRAFQREETRECDFSLIENQVMKALPEEFKISLRVVKYFLQTRLALPELCASFGSRG